MDPVNVILVVLIVICSLAAAVIARVLHTRGEPLIPPRVSFKPSPPRGARPISAQVRPPAPSPPAPAPAPLSLDRADPTVRSYELVLAQMEQAEVSVRGVPEAFPERVAMRTELMAMLGHLNAVGERLTSPDVSARVREGPQLERLAGCLTSIRHDAEVIQAGLEQLADRERTLTAEASALGDDLAALERRSPYPPAAGPVAAAGAALIGRVGQIPSRSAIASSNALKYRLREAEELRTAIGHCRAQVATLLDPQATLRALLELSVAEEARPGVAAEARQSPVRASAVTASPDDSEAALLERRLLTMALGDRGIVTRLIELERSRDPQAPRSILLQRAIERWENDRR